jgi:hypothetical protein
VAALPDFMIEPHIASPNVPDRSPNNDRTCHLPYAEEAHL